MDFTLFQLLIAFAFSLPLGFSLGIVYEPFRLYHKLGYTKNIHYLFSDIIFMCLCGFVTYIFSLALLDGSVRAFIVIGEILGFYIYFKLITPITDKIYEPSIKICKKIFRNLLKKGKTLMYNISKLIKVILHKLFVIFEKLINRVKRNERKKRKHISGRKTCEKHRRSKTKKKKAK